MNAASAAREAFSSPEGTGGRRSRRVAALHLVVAALALLLCGAPASAGLMTREKLAEVFPSPLIVGEQDDKLKIWPILKQGSGRFDLVGYAFESDDFAPIPGFGGTPPDLLISMTPEGTFLGVKVLRQHEPVFVDGLGEEPMNAFISQYAGMSMRHPIRVGRHDARSHGASSQTTVDGVSMATASTRIMNQEILNSALDVARQKLGFSQADTLGLRVIAKQGKVEPKSWQQLLDQGYVKDFTLTNKAVDATFAGTVVAHDTAGKPDEAFTHVYLAELDVPFIGRNLLGDAFYAQLMRYIEPGDHLVMVLCAGPWSPIPTDFVPASVPDTLGVTQNKFPVTVRDLGYDRADRGTAGMPAGEWLLLRLSADAGFNPATPWSFWMRLQREHGTIYPEKVAREFATDYSLPASLFDIRKPDAGPTWLDTWFARKWELGVVALMLVALVPLLIRQNGLVARAGPFAWFRYAYLAVTLGFIGWYAQAQLSIVTLVGVVRALHSDRDFNFLLFDPPSLVLWAFTIATLVVWGRGTFCGWLCPFGALQELIAWPAQKLKLRQIAIPAHIDRPLRLAKYVVLAGIVVAAIVSAPTVDKLNEVEPFKTAITLYFVRSWPFVVYAVGLLVLNLFVYKGFCRYLCPLGASLALVGRLRVFNWIPRRAECGTPCQLCKVKCRYGAIEPDGKINYPECFQCMDCVTIIKDPRQCVPEIVSRKRGRVIQPQPVAAE